MTNSIPFDFAVAKQLYNQIINEITLVAIKKKDPEVLIPKLIVCAEFFSYLRDGTLTSRQKLNPELQGIVHQMEGDILRKIDHLKKQVNPESEKYRYNIGMILKIFEK